MAEVSAGGFHKQFVGSVGNQGSTRNATLVASAPLGVVTRTLPLVTPVGTVAAIRVGETTVKTAGVPLKVTLVAPARLVPKIRTVNPTLPEVGTVLTNGPSPTDKLKMVPKTPAPPSNVDP